LSEAREMDWTSPLRYVKEYSGVEGVFLVDNEGLIVARATGKEIDDERLAPFMLGLEEVNNRTLRKINEKRISRIELYTSSRWINLTRIFNLILVTVANRYTDDLLNVRIVQAAEMIRKYMRKRYTQEVLTEAEDKNV
jgi:predicted regulator of Ras-like GTPase activity (Roadblock/LC7/MglB family)